MNYLIGAGGHGLVVQNICELINLQIDAFIDNTIKPPSIRGIPCLKQNSTSIDTNDAVIISIGDNASRRNLSSSLDCKFLTAIHPSVIMDRSVKVSEGTVLMAGAILNAFVIVGKHAIINTGAVIDHECVIGDFAHISPNATLCGNVVVGEGTHIGAGAVVIPGISIGKGCVIGAGAVVIDDIPDNTMVVGNPARVVKQINQY